MTDANEDRLLHAIFCLSRDTRPIDATILGRAAGLSATSAAEILVRLERAGLVDASRARLTMLGLARACQVGDQAGGKPLDLGAAEPSTRAPLSTPPLAARRERVAGVEDDEEGPVHPHVRRRPKVQRRERHVN